MHRSFDHLTNQLGSGMVLWTCAGVYRGVKGLFSSGALDKAGECLTIKESLSRVFSLNIKKIHVVDDVELL